METLDLFRLFWEAACVAGIALSVGQHVNIESYWYIHLD